MEEQESSEEELVDDDISSLNQDDYQGEEDEYIVPNGNNYSQDKDSIQADFVEPEEGTNG